MRTQRNDTELVSDNKLFKVSSAIAAGKKIAAETIGIGFAATGHDFLPCVEPSVLELASFQ